MNGPLEWICGGDEQLLKLVGFQMNKACGAACMMYACMWSLFPSKQAHSIVMRMSRTTQIHFWENSSSFFPSISVFDQSIFFLIFQIKMFSYFRLTHATRKMAINWIGFLSASIMHDKYADTISISFDSFEWNKCSTTICFFRVTFRSLTRHLYYYYRFVLRYSMTRVTSMVQSRTQIHNNNSNLCVLIFRPLS